MRSFTATYRHFFMVTVTIALLFPCSLKRELKQQVASEVSASLNFRVCNAFYANEVSCFNRFEKSATPSSPAFVVILQGIFTAAVSAPVEKYRIADKEKVRIYLRNQQLLI